MPVGQENHLNHLELSVLLPHLQIGIKSGMFEVVARELRDLELTLPNDKKLSFPKNQFMYQFLRELDSHIKNAVKSTIEENGDLKIVGLDLNQCPAFSKFMELNKERTIINDDNQEVLLSKYLQDKLNIANIISGIESTSEENCFQIKLDSTSREKLIDDCNRFKIESLRKLLNNTGKYRYSEKKHILDKIADFLKNPDGEMDSLNEILSKMDESTKINIENILNNKFNFDKDTPITKNLLKNSPNQKEANPSFWFDAMEQDFKKAFTYRNDNEITLKSPSISIILDYYASNPEVDSEYSQLENVYIVNDPNELAEILDYCDDFKDGQSIKLIFQGNGNRGVLGNGAHCNVILFEKRSGENHIVMLESTGNKGDYEYSVQSLIEANFSHEQLGRTTYYSNSNQRQSDPNSCSIFAVKDCKHIERGGGLVSEIQEKCNPSVVQERDAEKGKVKKISYVLPPRFMGLTQGESLITKYEQDNPGLAKEKIKNQYTIREHAFKERNKSQLPQTPKKKHDKKMNNSTEYFRKKYLKHIESLKSRFSKDTDTLKRRINRFNAHEHLNDIKNLNKSDKRIKRIETLKKLDNFLVSIDQSLENSNPNKSSDDLIFLKKHVEESIKRIESATSNQDHIDQTLKELFDKTNVSKGMHRDLLEQFFSREILQYELGKILEDVLKRINIHISDLEKQSEVKSRGLILHSKKHERASKAKTVLDEFKAEVQTTIEAVRNHDSTADISNAFQNLAHKADEYQVKDELKNAPVRESNIVERFFHWFQKKINPTIERLHVTSELHQQSKNMKIAIQQSKKPS